MIEKGGSSVRSASFPIKLARQGRKSLECEPPVRAMPTREGPSLAAPPPPPKKDPNGLETVVLELDGKAHDLQVGYVAETPVWRPSYRLVIDKQGSDLQAWGIVQNLSGEDWKGVTLSLIAGAPLAFEANLGSPHHPDATDRHRHGRGHRRRSAQRDQPQSRADGAAARRGSGSVGRAGRRVSLRCPSSKPRRDDSAPRKKGEAKKDTAQSAHAPREVASGARAAQRRPRPPMRAPACSPRSMAYSRASGAPARPALARIPSGTAQPFGAGRGGYRRRRDSLRPADPDHRPGQERHDGHAPLQAGAGRVDLPLCA